MSKAMLKKCGSNGLGEQPRSNYRSEITLYAEEIIEQVTQEMDSGQTEDDNGTDLLGLVN